jgi:nickel superoxide dismutase
MKWIECAAFVWLMSLLIAAPACSHCEIPCGIYDDEMRMKMIEEDITTIEKSMNQIEELSKAKEPNWNQIVRWVVNKDEHADRIAHVVTQYFMTQRIKAADVKDARAYARYIEELELLHGMLIYSMKSKQTTDTANTDTLRSLLGDFRRAYFGAAAGAGEKKKEAK